LGVLLVVVAVQAAFKLGIVGSDAPRVQASAGAQWHREGDGALILTLGRLVLIGLMGGAKAEINLGALLARRLQVIGSTLRARPVAEKAALVEAFLDRFGSALEKGQLVPVVDRVLPLAEAGEAHRAMKASEHFGKIVLAI
jgi:NADPH:quinone reductase-like Zn-dependent oxidoreductase